MAKIYIVPNSGQYAGTLLVFDHVDSMNHTSNSTIPQHPVESFERGRADHRYREGVKIQISGHITDNWSTEAVQLPSPAFQTKTFKTQKLLRSDVSEYTGSGSKVTKLVNKILDKTPVSESEVLNVDVVDRYWVSQAFRLVKEEKDVLSQASDKDMSLENLVSNTFTLGSQINTIAQAVEFLTYLDNNSTICTVVSLWKTYDNMVLTSFSNPLRNGAERGAYWISLNFEQQLIATTVSKPIAISPENSEEVNSQKDLGKQSAVSRPKTDATYQEVEKIWDEELKAYPRAKKYVTEKNKDAALQRASDVYDNAGDKGDIAELRSRRNIKASLQAITLGGK